MNAERYIDFMKTQCVLNDLMLEDTGYDSVTDTNWSNVTFTTQNPGW